MHWGFVLALFCAWLVWYLLWKTTLGFEIRTVGSNPDAAKYAGINVKRMIILTMAFSGALAGLAGAIEVIGLNYRHELGFSLGYGFDAIAIALLGKTHPAGVVLAAILFGGDAQRRHPHAVPDADPRGCDLHHPGAYSTLCCR